MKQFSNYEDAAKAAQFTGAEKLPVGAYVCKIMGIRYEAGKNGGSDVIVGQFDICEGPQKDFFKKKYDATDSDDKKWKGTFRIYCPLDDGTEKDTWTKNTFARWIAAIEKSNPGYSWDWDESKWKGKKLGIVFGETGTVIDGKEVVYVEPHGACSVEEVKDGTFWKKLLDLKKKNGFTGNGSAAPAPSASDFMSIPEGTEEGIPF